MTGVHLFQSPPMTIEVDTEATKSDNYGTIVLFSIRQRYVAVAVRCDNNTKTNTKETLMITVGMNYEVIEGKGEAFESMFAKVLEVMNDMDGHGESHLYVDVFKNNSYLIVSQWDSQNAFDSFIASDKFKSVTTWGKEQILAARPKHEVYGREEQAPAGKCPVH